MDDIRQETSVKPLPFNNLYLISGLVNGWNKGWMYITTLMFLILGYVLFQGLVFFPLLDRLIRNGYSKKVIEGNPNLLFDSSALQLDKNLVLALELGMFVFAFLGLLAGLKFIHKKSLLGVLTAYQRFRYSRFWFAFLIWSGLLIVYLGLSYFIYPNDFVLNINGQGLFFSIVVMALLMPIQTGLEEIVFRGYLLQGLSLVFKNGIIPLLLTSVLFGVAHLSNPEVKEFGWAIMLSYYVCFALFMGSITLLDEGIELAFGIHFANNIMSSILISTPNSVIKTYSLFETKNENPQTEILVWFFMAAMTFVVFIVKYRWKKFSLILK